MILNNDVLCILFKLLGPDYGLVLGLVCKDWHRVAALAWRGRRLLLSASALPVIPAKFHPNVTLTQRLPYELCASRRHPELLDYIIEKGCAPPLSEYIKVVGKLDPDIVEDVTKLLKLSRNDTPTPRVMSTYSDYPLPIADIVKTLFGDVGCVSIFGLFTQYQEDCLVRWTM
jgi:hypothetical protein